MLKQPVHRFIGTIIPMGNGAVGKTTLAALLAKSDSNLNDIRKSKNLEFEYTSDSVIFDGETYQVSQQYLIPPGQKESEGDFNSRSFEAVLQIYMDIIGIPQVILLTYDITNLESFYDLEFWVSQASRIADNLTELILVGTHLDSSEGRVVDNNMIAHGINFIEQAMIAGIPEWKGECCYMEVSNLNTINIAVLRSLITRKILRTKGILCFDESPVAINISSDVSV
jgi:GTPase SAR1 family protein